MTKMLGASHWWGVCACEQCRNGRANKAEQAIYKRAQRRKERRAWRKDDLPPPPGLDKTQG